MTLAFVPVLVFFYMLMPFPKTVGVVASVASFLGLLAFLMS